MNEEMSNRKSQLLKVLAEGPVTVTFTKKNGEVRNMVCTINSQYIKDFESIRGYQCDPNQVRVFDVEKDGWRSFFFFYVIEWKQILNE